MKTFDRAMYAIFLLVLLADVARAETLVPAGVGASSTMVLRAAAQSSAKTRVKPRISPAADAVASFGSAGDITTGSVSDASAVRAELFSTYRAAYRRYVLANGGSTRNLFDGSTFAIVDTLAPVAVPQTVTPNAPESSVSVPARPVLEHIISPAP
jgi:hypothetical protein